MPRQTAPIPFFCVNLASRPDRWAEMQAEAAYVTGGIDLRRIEAVDGGTQQFKDDFAMGKFPPKFRTPGEYACYLSHLKALEIAEIEGCATSEDPDTPDLDQSDFVGILEDDILLVDGFNARLEAALDTAPNVPLLYIGYLRYKMTKVDGHAQQQQWLTATNLFGGHGYLIRREKLGEYIAFLRKCDQAVDDYMTYSAMPSAIVAQPLVYQRVNSASDVTTWHQPVNPSASHIINPLHFKFIWPKHQAVAAAGAANHKLLHILPGQHQYFPCPPEWTVKVWQRWDEVYEYRRYGKVVPFAYWVVWRFGGIALPRELTHSFERFWLASGTRIDDEVVVACAYDRVLTEKIRQKVFAHQPFHNSEQRWGDVLPLAEMAPQFA